MDIQDCILTYTNHKGLTMNKQTEISYLIKQKAMLLKELGVLHFNNQFNQEYTYQLENVQYRLQVLQGVIR
jgi:hypothetical protein